MYAYVRFDNNTAENDPIYMKPYTKLWELYLPTFHKDRDTIVKFRAIISQNLWNALCTTKKLINPLYPIIYIHKRV